MQEDDIIEHTLRYGITKTAKQFHLDVRDVADALRKFSPYMFCDCEHHTGKPIFHFMPCCSNQFKLLDRYANLI